ncbi:MAG: hypothetical protein ACOCQW_02510 [Halanaerobiaceae bacterium]
MIKKEKVRHGFILCFLTFMVLISGISYAESQEETYDWHTLKVKYDKFLMEQSEENKLELLNILPQKSVKPTYNEVLSDIFLKNFKPLENLAQKGDLLAIKILFRFRLLTDGAMSEWINIVIGRSITSNPTNFLIALEENMDRYTRIYHFLGALGDDYVDKPQKQADALLERYLAINSVETDKYSDISLYTKYLCLNILSGQISQSTTLLFMMDDKTEMLDYTK